MSGPRPRLTGDLHLVPGKFELSADLPLRPDLRVNPANLDVLGQYIAVPRP